MITTRSIRELHNKLSRTCLRTLNMLQTSHALRLHSKSMVRITLMLHSSMWRQGSGLMCLERAFPAKNTLDA